MGKYQQRDRIARLISWGHWFTFGNIFLCLLISLLYVENALPTGSSLGNGYLFVSWLGHFAFLPFVIFIIALFPLCLIIPYSKILRGYAALLATIGLFTLLFDAIFFRQYGFHLNTYSLNQLSLDAEEWFAGGSFVLLSIIIFAFLIIFALQLTLANLTWKRLPNLQGKPFAKAFTGVFIASFFISHSTHIWADANLYAPITQHDDLFPLSYPTTAKSLMARHGWISIEQFQNRQDQLTQAQQLTARYPVGPMLCSKEFVQGGSVVFAFSQIDVAMQAALQSRIPGLTQHQGMHLGHAQLDMAVMTLLYGVPDLYSASLKQQNALPAYLQIMNDYGTPVRFQRTREFPEVELPEHLHTSFSEWQQSRIATSGLQVILVTPADLDDVLAFIEQYHELSNQVIITGLVPAELAHNSIRPEHINVPLYTLGTHDYPRRLTTIEDVMPTAIQPYMSCAEGFRNFTNGLALNQPGRTFPRVYTVRPNLFIFEAQQTTVIDSSGDMLLFNAQGDVVPGAVPPTPVFIQSLRELQRFAEQ